MRLDSLESKSVEVDSHLGSIDTSIERVEASVEQVGISMSTQFSAVMKQLSDMAELQRRHHHDEPRKKQATAPFGGSGRSS